MRHLISITFIMLVTCPVWADHDLDIYWFDDLFIYDTFGKSGRIFNVVVLDDKANLKIAGQVTTPADYNVRGYANYKKFLIVLIMTRVEIYDLGNPTQPTLVKTFRLQDQGSHPSGVKGIAPDNNTYTLLSYRSAAKLTMDDDSAKWKIENLKQRPKFQREDVTSYRSPPLLNVRGYPWPFVVKETPKFRYEVAWEVETLKSGLMHKKYLRKVNKKDGRAASSLFLGEELQTRGE